jgi:hypothetical protein
MYERTKRTIERDQKLKVRTSDTSAILKLNGRRTVTSQEPLSDQRERDRIDCALQIVHSMTLTLQHLRFILLCGPWRAKRCKETSRNGLTQNVQESGLSCVLLAFAC